MLFTEYELWPCKDLDIFSLSEVPEQIYKDALYSANRYFNNDWGLLLASMYTDARHEQYDGVYKMRRIALSSLALGEYLERKGQFLQDIINGIWCLCEESTWIPPDGTQRLKNSEVQKLDIDSARTAALLATTVQILKKELPSEVCHRVRYEIKRRVLEPFYESAKIGRELAAQTFIACMLTEEDEDRRRMAVEKILNLLDGFLQDYTAEKVFVKNEESLYTVSAYIFDILEMLYHVTDRKFEVYSDEKVKYVADTIYKTYLGSDGFSEKETEEDGARIYLFGKRMDYKKLMDYGASEFLAIENKTLPTSANLFHKLYSVKHASEIIRYGDNFDDQECGYIESMDLFVKKTKNFSVAIKGGQNAAGNLMVYLENEPYVVDLEKSHNLPIINGFNQFSNTKGVVLEKKENGLCLDLARTYPKDAGVKSWIRSIEAEEKYIIITDDYELDRCDDLRIVLLMKDKPILSGDRIIVGNGQIVWDGDLALRAELVKSKTYNYIYRLIFHVKSRELSGRVRIALRK